MVGNIPEGGYGPAMGLYVVNHARGSDEALGLTLSTQRVPLEEHDPVVAPAAIVATGAGGWPVGIVAPAW